MWRASGARRWGSRGIASLIESDIRAFSVLLAVLNRNTHHVHHGQCVWTFIVQGKLRRVAGWAPVRFLRIMSENDDRTEERSRAVEKPEDFEDIPGGRAEGLRQGPLAGP